MTVGVPEKAQIRETLFDAADGDGSVAEPLPPRSMGDEGPVKIVQSFEGVRQVAIHARGEGIGCDCGRARKAQI